MDIPNHSEFDRIALLSAQTVPALDKAIKENTAKYIALLKGIKDVQVDEGLKGLLVPAAETMQKYMEELPKNELKLLSGIPPHFTSILLINEPAMTPDGPTLVPYSGERPKFDAVADPRAKGDVERMGVTEAQKHFLFAVNMHPGFSPNVHITFPTGYRIISRMNHIPMNYTDDEKRQKMREWNEEMTKDNPSHQPITNIEEFNKILSNWQMRKFEHVTESQSGTTNVPTDPSDGQTYIWPDGTLFLHLVVQRDEKPEESEPVADSETPEAKKMDEAADFIAQLGEDAKKAGVEWPTQARFQYNKVRKELNHLHEIFANLEQLLSTHQPPLAPDDEGRFEQCVQDIIKAKKAIETYERDQIADYPWSDVIVPLYKAIQAFEHLHFVRLGVSVEALKAQAEQGSDDDKKKAKKHLKEIEEFTKRYQDALRALKKAYPEVQQVLGSDIELHKEAEKPTTSTGPSAELAGKDNLQYLRDAAGDALKK
jgi:hypothetical protein